MEVLVILKEKSGKKYIKKKKKTGKEDSLKHF